RKFPALALVRGALNDLQGLPDNGDKAFQLTSAGELLRQIAHDGADAAVAEAARSTLLQAAGIAGRIGDARSSSNAWGYLAELAADQNQAADALALNDRALFEAQIA